MTMKQVGWGYRDSRGALRLQAAKPTARTRARDGRPVVPFALYASNVRTEESSAEQIDKMRRAVEKCRWVIEQNKDKPHVVAKWQAELDELLGIEHDADYWRRAAEVCLARAKMCEA